MKCEFRDDGRCDREATEVVRGKDPRTWRLFGRMAMCNEHANRVINHSVGREWEHDGFTIEQYEDLAEKDEGDA